MKKGFTLIELLVCIGIVAICVAMLVVAINSSNKKKCEEAGYDPDSEECIEFLEQDTEEPKKEKPKKETNLDKAKRICPTGILEFEGDPDSTWGEDFQVTCK